MKQDDLRLAGFTDREISEYIAKKTPILLQAGYSQEEIHEYFGTKPFDPDPLKLAVQGIAAGPLTGKEKSALGRKDDSQNEFLPNSGGISYLEAFKAGFQGSVTGLDMRGQLPDKVVPKDAPLPKRTVAQLGTLAGDFPYMVAGGVIGGTGGMITAAGGAFGLPAGLRKVYIDKINKGEITSKSEFVDRLKGAVWETLKGETVGMATKGAGNFAGLPGEIMSMVGVSSALEGEIPEFTDFLDAAVLVGGLKSAEFVGGKLQKEYELNGKQPDQVRQEAAADTGKKEHLLGDLEEPSPIITPEVIEYPAEVELPPRNPLTVVSSQDGSITNQVLDELISPEKTKKLLSQDREELISTLHDEVPEIEWSSFPDSSKMLKAYTEHLAKQEGYDALVSLSGNSAVETVPLTGPSAGVSAFNPEKGFKRRAPGKSNIDQEMVKRSDIVKFLQKKLDLTFRVGKFRAPGALGIFKLKNEAIRTKLANDIETISHEMGHALHKFLWPDARDDKGLTDAPFEGFREELEPLASTPGAGQDVLPEGFAEFIRLYITNEKLARQEAPEFYKNFDSLLKNKTPETREIFLQAREMYDRFMTQPELMRVLSQISVGEHEKKSPSWDKFYTAVFDDLHPLKKVVEAMAKGGKIAASKNPYKLARLLRGWWGKAEYFLEIAPFDFKTYEDKGKSLKAIMKNVSDLDEFRGYIVSKRALELHRRGIESGIYKEDAIKVINNLKSKYDKTFEELKDFQDKTLQYLRDSGVISEKSYSQMKKANAEYVPFYRIMETEDAKGTGKGLESHNPVKKIKGSWRDIADPLESIIKNTYMYINLAEKNAVGQALVGLSETYEGTGKFIDPIPTPLQRISIQEPELLGIFDKVVKIFESSKSSTKETSKEKVTKGDAEGQSSAKTKALQRVERTAREALTARGFTEAEAQQMIDRIKSAPAGKRSTLIEKTIEKIVVKEKSMELGWDIPDGVVHIFRPKNFVPDKDIITVFKNGKQKYYQVHPDVAEAFKALDREQIRALLHILGVPARTLRAGAILSPDFIIRNPTRDLFTAFIYSKHGIRPAWDFVKGVSSLLKKDEHYQMWLKSGAAHSMLTSLDRKYLQKNLRQIINDTPVRNLIKNPIEALRALTELSEAGTRIGEFRRGDGSVSKESSLEAGYDAREVTLDFSRQGANASIRALNTIIAFWNAQVQGMDKMRRAFKERPGATTLKAVASITLPSVMLTIVNRKDERWKEIPQWQKDLFWIVMTPKHVYRIPKPFELGIIFGTVPERMIEYILDKDPAAFDGLLATIGRGAAPGAVPTVMTPLIENWANKSIFLDRPLVGADRERWLPEYQYRPYTTEMAKKIGSLLGSVPALERNPYIAPAKLENLVRGWSGGLGMYIVRLTDLALRKTGALPDPIKPAMTLADIPVIKAFVVRHPSSGAESVQKFYDDYAKAQELKITIDGLVKKEGRLSEAMRLFKDHESDMPKLDNVHKALKNQSSAIQKIYQNQNMSASDKRQNIDIIYYQMIQTAKAGNKILKQLRGK